MANHALGWRGGDPRQHLRRDQGGEVLQHSIAYRPLEEGGTRSDGEELHLLENPESVEMADPVT